MVLGGLLYGKPLEQGSICCYQSPSSGITTKNSFSLSHPVRRMLASQKVRLEARLVSAEGSITSPG